MITVEHAHTGHRELERELRRFIARRVESADVDDVVQEVFVRLQRGVAGLRGEERFVPWLHRVARNAVADHRRARARHPLVGADGSPPEDEAASEPDEDSEAIEQRLSACVPVFVAMLPREYRDALTLTELQGMTQREAAELAGVSLSGMKSRVQRGRERLRALFEACCAVGVDVRGRVIACDPRPAGSPPSCSGRSRC